jgi:hypothetical protein
VCSSQRNSRTRSRCHWSFLLGNGPTSSSPGSMDPVRRWPQKVRRQVDGRDHSVKWRLWRIPAGSSGSVAVVGRARLLSARSGHRRKPRKGGHLTGIASASGSFITGFLVNTASQSARKQIFPRALAAPSPTQCSLAAGHACRRVLFGQFHVEIENPPRLADSTHDPSRQHGTRLDLARHFFDFEVLG